jgi:alginate O-acetyltransferase complex protein AlgI
MQFTQPVFFLFIVVFFLGWRLFSARSDFRLLYLVIASFAFYSFGDARPLLVLIAAGLISFAGGIGIESLPRHKRLILAASMIASLGLLLVFKYSDFLATNLNSLFALAGLKLIHLPLIPGLQRMPSLGISFYILQAVGYLLDVYHGRLRPSRDVLHYFAFLALFPKLLAGPIERGKDLLPQLTADHVSPTETQRWEGAKLIIYGYFSKAVIADNLAPLVDSAFGAVTVRPESLYWWVVVTAFAFQLLCDFSGYSAIALGLGKWMGYDLTVNFKHPYTSVSLTDFWARWHISLSNWLRDYIFFPLNRSRWGRGHPYINAFITMLVSGLWHGAAWQFIAWGGLHGLYISLERLTQWPSRLKRFRWGRWAALIVVLFQVWVSWVFFRAANIPQALQILKAMFSFSGGLGMRIDASYSVFLAVGMLREGFYLFHLGPTRLLPAPLKNGLEVVLVSLLIAVCILLHGPGSQFIYFQF